MEEKLNLKWKVLISLIGTILSNIIIFYGFLPLMGLKHDFLDVLFWELVIIYLVYLSIWVEEGD